MTSIRMALTELRRLTAGRPGRLALLALVLVPTLYGGLYLYANQDPYGRLDQVPAALVVLDQGTTDTEGQQVRAGEDVADELVRDQAFDWHRVSAAHARDGVRDGTYDFGLTIPEDFSTALTSAASFDPRQAQLRMTTNDADSYLSTTIADTVTGKVRDALEKKVGTEAAQQFLLGLAEIRTSLAEATDSAEKLVDGLNTVGQASQEVRTGARDLSDGAGKLDDGLGTLESRTSALPGQTRELADGAGQVAAGTGRVSAAGNRIGTASASAAGQVATRRVQLRQRMTATGMDATQQSQVLAVYDALGARVRSADTTIQRDRRQLDTLAAGARQVATGADALADGAPALAGGVSDAHAAAGTLATGADELASRAGDLRKGVTRLQRGEAALARDMRQGLAQIPAIGDTTRERIARTIGNPVEVSDAAPTSAGSYGAGLAPFFMALATWIGGYVLFLLVRPLSRRAMAANQTPLRVALGGWITPALVGAAQMVLLLAVVLVGVRLGAADVPGTLLFLLLMSATFVAILHALNAWLGPAGQFLGLVLMVLQLVTAGGTFPWQTIPQPLHVLHHALPMSYAVDGLRQLMYGGLSGLVLRDVLVLLGWLVAALLVTTLAARRQRVWTLERVRPSIAL